MPSRNKIKHNKAEQDNRIAARSVLAPFGRACRLPWWTGAIACPSTFGNNMRTIRAFAITIIALWLVACSKRDEKISVLIDPIIDEVLIERGVWMVVQHTASGGEGKDVSYSVNLDSGDGSYRVFQCFSGGQDDGWHIQDFGNVKTSLEDLYPDTLPGSWSDLPNQEQEAIDRLLSKLDARLGS